MPMPMQSQSAGIDLNQGAKGLTPVHAGRARHRRNLLRKQRVGLIAVTAGR